MPDTSEHGKILLEWNFREFPRYRRGRGWYAWMIIGGAALVVIALFQQNPLFAIFVVIAWALLFYRSRLSPLQLTARITEDGLEVGRDFFAFEDLDAFWIFYRPRAPKHLVVRFKSLVRPKLDIPIDDLHPVDLRRILRQFLREDVTQTEESASDAFGRLLKF